MFVYLIRLPDNKAYIGSTSNLSKRLKEHKSFSKTKKNLMKVSEEIAKYGWEAVFVEVLLICSNRKEAYSEERRIIAMLKDKFVLLNQLDRPESWYKYHREKKVSSEQMSRISMALWNDQDKRKNMSIIARRNALANREDMSRRQALSRAAFVENRPLIKVYSKDQDNKLLLETKITSEVASLIGVSPTSVNRYVRGERKPRKFKIEVDKWL